MNLNGPESGQQVASSPWQGDMNSVRAADAFWLQFVVDLCRLSSTRL
jgi:hypothetical protein